MAKPMEAVRFEQPLGEINTTPLIDVMLVLLVMLILTIPAAVNQVPVDLPPIEDQPQHIINHDKNLVAITPDNRITWNAGPVSESELAGLLQASRKLAPEPELQFEPAPDASYDTAAKVLNTIKRSGITAFGFVGNDRYTRFGKAAPAR